MPQVIFVKPWGPKSWIVTHTAPFYENSRTPHVEVIGDTSTCTGAVNQLYNCRVEGKAIIWDVMGRVNGGKMAHFTVGHYASHEEALARFVELCALCEDDFPRYTRPNA